MPIRTTKKHLLYENQWTRFWRDEIVLPNGQAGEYTYVDRVDQGALIIPITNEGKLVVLREYRYPVADFAWCFPCGGCHPGEDVLALAKRELQEETGYVGDEWIDLGEIAIDPGGSSQKEKVYLVRGLKKVSETEHEASEEIEVHEFTLAEIEEKIASGEMTSGWLLAGLSKARRFL